MSSFGACCNFSLDAEQNPCMLDEISFSGVKISKELTQEHIGIYKSSPECFGVLGLRHASAVLTHENIQEIMDAWWLQ